MHCFPSCKNRLIKEKQETNASLIRPAVGKKHGFIIYKGIELDVLLRSENVVKLGESYYFPVVV